MPQISNSFALYIHIPWCVQKCPYCDFNSHAITGPVDESAYLDALLADFELDHQLVSDRLLSTIFIGGGTPSTLSAEFYKRMLEGLQALAAFDKEMEITLEANPGTVEASNFKGYREAGINRLSMGFQSLQNEKLKALGRIHSAEQAHEAFAIARNAGFANINIDLMFGLPGQSVEDALSDLEEVIALAPEHISWYQLTMEPNTAFFANPPKNIPDDDFIWDMQQAGFDLLRQAGFQQYEISAYSRKTTLRCRHNLNYWLFGDYVGIGAGAHGKITLRDGYVVRRTKQRHPQAYLSGVYLSQEKKLQAADLVIEFLMNCLRLEQGFSQDEFLAATNQPVSVVAPALELVQAKSLLECSNDRYRPTLYGRRYLNDLLTFFI